tara:strand:- start:763 stop:1062 length:300 start_codon:yes stop_codon:yes gene_type:complete
MNASASGYKLDRFPGLEWQDDVAEEVASQIILGRSSRDVATEVMQKHEKYQQVHLRWACQDGIARGVLRAQQQKGLFDFDSAESRVSESSSLPPPPPVR